MLRLYLCRGFNNLLEQDDKEDVSAETTGPAPAEVSAGIQISAERLLCYWLIPNNDNLFLNYNNANLRLVEDLEHNGGGIPNFLLKSPLSLYSLYSTRGYGFIYIFGRSPRVRTFSAWALNPALVVFLACSQYDLDVGLLKRIFWSNRDPYRVSFSASAENLGRCLFCSILGLFTRSCFSTTSFLKVLLPLSSAKVDQFPADYLKSQISLQQYLFIIKYAIFTYLTSEITNQENRADNVYLCLNIAIKGTPNGVKIVLNRRASRNLSDLESGKAAE
ncbi:hypothetical protein V6N13_061214 [Hibiscus sabdariffa]